jgi:hypothetical protein
MELTMPPRMLSPSTFSQCEGCCRIRGVYSEGRFQERNLRESTRHAIWSPGPSNRPSQGWRREHFHEPRHHEPPLAS